MQALYDGQDELARTTPPSTRRSSSSGRRWAGSTSTSTSPSGSTRGCRRPSPSSTPTDPEQAKALRQDVLFYVRQKHQDLLTQLAVSIQNYLAIDVVIKNNIELDQGRRPGHHDHDLGAAHRRHRGAGAEQPEARARPDHRAQRDDVEPHPAHQRDAPGQLGADPAAGGLGDDRPAAAAGRVREHLPDDGRDRHVQGAGAGHRWPPPSASLQTEVDEVAGVPRARAEA